MAHRVAFASTDGIVVNEHFGRADRFHIAEIEDDGTWKFIESRDVTPVCNGGDHESEAFDRVLHRLKDVEAIVVSKIGDGASGYLESRGKTVYIAPFLIRPLLSKIIEDKLYEVDQWQ